MNRVWLVCNATLSLILVLCLLAQVAPAPARAAAAEPGDHGGASPSLTPGAISVQVFGSRREPRLLVRFPTAMVLPDRVGGEPRDLRLHLDPANPVLASWQDPRALVLSLGRPVERAQHHTLHFGQALTAVDGRQLAAGTQVQFATDPVRVERVVVEGEDFSADRALLVGFDLPVDLDSLRAKLAVQHLGRPVPFEVQELGRAGEHVYRVALRPAPTTTGRPVEVDAVDVVVRRGLRPAQGDVPTRFDARHHVVFRAPLLLRQVRPAAGAIELDFNRQVPRPAPDQITVQPDCPFQVQMTYRGLRLIGAFPPEQTVTVALVEGFPGVGRVQLTAPVRRSVLLPPAAPRLEFGQRGSVLSVKARPELEIQGTNVNRFGCSIRRLYHNNVVRHLQGDGGADALFEPGRETVVEVAAARNQDWTHRVDLRRLLGAAPRGIYRVAVWDADNRAGSRSRVIQVTDLGVTFRSTPTAVAVQVRSLATGAPVADAEVQVVTPTNQGLVFGRTDADGIAVLAYRQAAEDRVPFLVQVRKGPDRAFVDLRSHAVELTDDTLAGREYLTAGVEAYVQPARGILRPGATFEATVLVRDRAGQAPSGLELTAVFGAPGGREWGRQQATLSGAGLLRVTRAIPASAPTGRWLLRLEDRDGTELGRASFTVEAFVPNRLEAEVAVVEPLRIGQVGKVRVRARWLDGAPAVRRPVVLRMRLNGATFQPPEFPGYSFARTRMPAPPGALPPIRARLDDRGEAILEVPIPATAKPQSLSAQITAEVEDPSGRPVFETRVVPVHRPAFHLGIRKTATGAEIVAVDADGRLVPLPGTCTFAVEWRRYEWKTVQRRGGWRYETEVLAVEAAAQSVRFEGGRARVAPVAAPPVPAGSWVVWIARRDGQVCELAPERPPARPDRLRVRGPVAATPPGGTAVVEVEAPAAGRGFLTVEGCGIHSARMVTLAQGHNEIDVPIPADLDLPNVHAVVTLTRAVATKGDPGPFWLIGGASISIAHAARGTAVGLQGPAEVRPESPIDFAIHAPGATQATLALVDEGVLNLTRHTDPDPLAFFLARRRLDSRGADIGGFMMKRVRFLPGVQTGGDGGSGLSAQVLAGSVNSRIRPVALFVEVALDRQGRGAVRLTPPPYEGRLRAMVIAAGPRVVGAAVRSVTVKAPLSVLVAMPRMMAPGDRAQAAITIKNNTPADGTIAVSLAPAPGMVVAADARQHDLQLPAGGIRTLYVPFGLAIGQPESAAAPGRLQVLATMADERRTVTGEVLVRRPAVTVREVRGLRLGQPLEVTLDERWLGPEVAVELRVDDRPALHLRGALQSLLDYPYGCLEQTTSRAMGLLACRSMLPQMLGDQAPAVLPLLQAGVDRIFAMQCSDGGFGWWPGQRASYDFGTVHALDFLLAARALGADVPAAGMQRAVDALARIVRRHHNTSLRCHAVEVLARAGRPVQPWLDFLAAAAELPDDRARVALALARTGHRDRARALLDHREYDAGRPSDPMLRSKVRNKALELRARLAIGDDGAAEQALVRYLDRVMARPKRYHTQDKAQALRALAEYYSGRPVPPATGAPVVVVRQGDRQWRTDARGRLACKIDPRRPLRIEGSGVGFAALEVTGRQPAAATTATDEVALDASVVDLTTGRPATRFERGRLYEITVKCQAPRGVENFLITQLLPGGFEIDPPRPGLTRQQVAKVPCQVERRDDRILIFVPGSVRGAVEFRYRVRAVFAGRFHAPPVRFEAMYEPELCVTTPPLPPVEVHGR